MQALVPVGTQIAPAMSEARVSGDRVVGIATGPDGSQLVLREVDRERRVCPPQPIGLVGSPTSPDIEGSRIAWVESRGPGSAP